MPKTIDIDIDALVEEAVKKVCGYSSPRKMTREQALDFMQDVISRLEDEAEALRVSQ